MTHVKPGSEVVVLRHSAEEAGAPQMKSASTPRKNVKP